MKRRKRRYPKNRTLATKMLEVLEVHHPAGVPTGKLATVLYGRDTRENREKVRNLARTLRAMGYFVYGLDGLYKLCTDPDELIVIFERSVVQSRGMVVSTDNVALGIGKLGDERRAAEAKRLLKKMLLDLAAKIG